MKNLKPLEVGHDYMTKFQVPEPVRVVSVLTTRSENQNGELIEFPKNVYVSYLDNPNLGLCLLDADRIVHEQNFIVEEEKDIRLYYFKDAGLKKIGRGSTLHSIGHRHKSISECKKAIHTHVPPRFFNLSQTVQFVIVEYTGALQAKIIEVLNKKYE